MKRTFEQYEATFFKHKKIYDEGGLNNDEFIKRLKKYERVCELVQKGKIKKDGLNP